MLVDTAPLIALIDAGQGEAHHRCVEAYQKITSPLLTTWCCFTEAMYFLYQLQGWFGQDILWQFVDRSFRIRFVSIHHILPRRRLEIGFIAKIFYSKIKYLFQKIYLLFCLQVDCPQRIFSIKRNPMPAWCLLHLP